MQVSEFVRLVQPAPFFNRAVEIEVVGLSNETRLASVVWRDFDGSIQREFSCGHEVPWGSFEVDSVELTPHGLRVFAG